MKSKINFTMALALIAIFVFAATALADTARGKLIPNDSIAPKAGGSYVLKTIDFPDQPNVHWVSITIRARKLEPNAYYRVGWIQNHPDHTLGDNYFLYDTVQVDSKGSLTFSLENHSSYSGLDWTFQAIVEPSSGAPGDDYIIGEPWALYGEEVPLFFE